jgi:hypothetical protein
MNNRGTHTPDTPTSKPSTRDLVSGCGLMLLVLAALGFGLWLWLHSIGIFKFNDLVAGNPKLKGLNIEQYLHLNELDAPSGHNHASSPILLLSRLLKAQQVQGDGLQKQIVVEDSPVIKFVPVELIGGHEVSQIGSVAFVSWDIVAVGVFTDGRPAYQWQGSVKVVDIDRSEVTASTKVFGAEPPRSKSRSIDYTLELLPPIDEVKEWLYSLHPQ